MCGFVTLYNPYKSPSSSKEEVDLMCDLIEKRGPDHYGFYQNENIMTGCRRLSILDLSQGANIPFTKGDFTISYNGEVYNYLEIKERLNKEKNIIFNTKSDTEVVLEAYLEYGPKCLRMFNGMFAFTIWNKKEKTLFVARDRLGIKPLFYSVKDNNYYFASDIKSLWQKIDPSQLNHNAILDFFGQGYISKKETSTKGIYKFPNAHYWILSKDKIGSPKRYWDLEYKENFKTNFKDAVEQTELLIEDSVRIRMRSDVPIGTFLSGGIDSTIVTGVTKKLLGRDLNTFSVGFDNSKYDESRFSFSVAKKLNTNHENIKLDKSALDNLPSIVWHYSELYSDSSSLPTFYVSKLASKKLKVVLTGDGADEIFGGYLDPYAYHMINKFNNFPSLLKTLTHKAFGTKFLQGNSRIRKLLKLSKLSLEEGYLSLRSGNWGEYKDCFKISTSLASNSLTHYLNEFEKGDNVQKLIYADIKDRLSYDFLYKVDMGSMANSLEARSPFLDYRLFDYGFSLDHKILYHGLKRKAILKKIAEKYLDKKYINRRKMGFSIPKYDWLSEKNTFKNIKKIINRKSSIDGIINREKMDEIIYEFENGNENHSNRVWQILIYQIWDGLFISKEYVKEQKLTDL